MCFFFQAEDGIRDKLVTGVQTCALPISPAGTAPPGGSRGHDLLGEDQLAPDFRTVAPDLHRPGPGRDDGCLAERGGHHHASVATPAADRHRRAGQVPQGRQPALSEAHADPNTILALPVSCSLVAGASLSTMPFGGTSPG